MRAPEVIQTPAAELRLVGGCLCLDFTNTVGGRRTVRGGTGGYQAQVLHEKLRDYGDLIAWSEHVGIISRDKAVKLSEAADLQSTEAAVVLSRALTLREALFRVMKSFLGESEPRQPDLDVLNGELSEARSHEQLARGGDWLVVEWRTDPVALDQLLWPVVRSAAELLTSEELRRLRECEGEDCGWLFLDKSRNRSRHWCYMQGCGNLAKVRRFRARRRHASAG
jgi:predicted RNA-binding Zn ribbon-like protein